MSIKYSSDQLSMNNSQDLNHKATARVNISYQKYRKRRLKKSFQYTKVRVSTTPTPSKLRVVSMDEAISRNTSFFAPPHPSLNVCMSHGEASYELRDSSRQMQTQDNENHILCSEGCLVEYCVHSRNAEMEASVGDNSTQVDQDNVSLIESKMIQTPRQKRETTVAYSPSPASTHDQITYQVSGPSGTDPEERTKSDQRFPIFIRKTLIGAPSRAEIEEFFADSPKQCQQKLLTARYNFDFENDVPLQGRYQWISLTHS